MNEVSAAQKSVEIWDVKAVDPAEIQKYAKALSIDPFLARVLLARNICDGNIPAIKEFLNPSKELIRDTRYITSEEHLNRAIARVRKALENSEKIVVNGDPDADGITGSSIIVAGLRHLGGQVTYDFPTRSKEGHGLQPRIIDESKRDGVTLIITSDCGSKDVESVDYAKSLGIDVIICDHHVLGRTLPNSEAIINPYLAEGATQTRHLAGAGVSFKLILAIFNAMGVELPKILYEFLLALAALGTLSDRMSLLAPMNRIIVKKGVAILNHTRLIGLKTLKDISSGDHLELKPRDISRTISPRLNAPGRIGDRDEGIPDSRIVVDLLLLDMSQESLDKAQEYIDQFTQVLDLEQEIRIASQMSEKALYVDELNEKRKRITSKIEDEIEKNIQEQVDLERDKIIVVRGKDWNSGVIGIDVDRLRERFLRPAMILTEYSGSEYLRASVRSIPGINVYHIIDTVAESFERDFGKKLFQVEVDTELGKRSIHAFGGHSQACGFVIHKDNLTEFTKRLHLQMDTLPEDSFKFTYEIIDTLTFPEISPALIHKLDKLGPYGQYFEFPLFMLKNCYIGKQARPFGNKYQKFRTPHVDFMVIEKTPPAKKSRALRLSAVGFGLWEKYRTLVTDHPDVEYDVIFTLENVKRKGNKKHRSKAKLRLNVIDIRCSEAS